MSARQPRFEVVHSDAGWFARFRAANGRIVWVTESYQRRGKAVAAVELIAGNRVREFSHGLEVVWHGNRDYPTEVRIVDERTAVTP